MNRQARKRALLAQSALLRRQLGQDYLTLVSPAERVLDRVVGAGQWLRQRPWLLGGLALAWLLWRPRRATGAVSLGGRLWVAWQAWQRWQPLVRSVVGLAGGVLAARAASAQASAVSSPHHGTPGR